MHNIKFKEIIDKIVISYQDIIKDNLAGIYLHGSVAMDCATENSDIDLLVVVYRELSHKECRQIVDATMGLGGQPKKGVEMSIVLEQYCQNIVHPTPFILHYSDEHRARYIANKDYICGEFADPDLAAHFTTTKYRGICLCGEPIDLMFAKVPRELYLDSIFYDIAEARENVVSDSVYHILNLCRTLAYVRDDIILSKLEGGQWAIENVDAKYIDLVKQAVAIYTCESSNVNFEINLIYEFVEYIYAQINFIP